MSDDDAHDEKTEQERQEDGQREQGVRSEDSEDLSSPQFTRRANGDERAATSPDPGGRTERPR